MMVMKIVDVPEGAEEFLFEAYKNEMLVGKTQEGYVSSLPDAPTVAENATVEKRVIELPADSIAWLERMKSNLETVDVYDLFNNVLADASGSYVSYQLNFNSETAALNTVAEWVLGHVEFVPKKEPKFVVFVEFGFKTNLVEVVNFKKTGKRVIKFLEMSDWEALVEEALEYGEVGDLPSMTELEADKLIAGLGGENGFLQPRKVKVEE